VKPSIVHVGLALLVASVAGPVARAFPAYYDISDTAQAQTEARQRNLPLAYLGSYPECLTDGSPKPGSEADLTQMALATLQGNAVVIFFDGHNMAPVPAIIHAQYHIHDDGELPGGISWYHPKVVFANPEITKILGRVSYTQMKAGRDIPLNSALQVIRNDPTALAPPPPTAAPDANGPSATSKESPLSTVNGTLSLISWISDNTLYLVAGLILILAVLFFWLARSRQ